MSKAEKELHEQVEQQRISLKKLIDKHTSNSEKVQIQKQQAPQQEKNLNSNKL
jgi:hypothetical protein